MSMRIPGVLPKASQSLNNTLRIGHSPLFTDVSYSAHSSGFGKVAALRTSLETPTPRTYHNYWSISFYETSSVFSMLVQLLFVQV